MDAAYARYRSAIAEGRRPLPLALVDLDAFDRNVDTLLAPVRARGKRLRVATKSIRCVELIRRVLERGGGVAKGLMSFAPREADFLLSQGFDDILVAYPSLQPTDLRAIAEANRHGTVSIVADAPEHLEALHAAAREAAVTIPVIIEVDVSFRPLGGRVHLGVQRSPLRSAEAVLDLAERVASHRGLRLHGIMGYEAHIAGLQDANPFAPLLNPPKRLIRQLSRGPVETLRAEIAEGLKRRGLQYEVFNGGGTGSVSWSSSEDVLTEVTAGSGFLDSHLFDYYRNGPRLEPAAFFALQVVRRPQPGIVTCMGGGYVASGPAGSDKLPLPWLPRGVALLGVEGAGEVQTPLTVPDSVHLSLGDPVFFRHAKAGELAEHFTSYQLLRGAAIASEAPTYRGMGRCFP